jgi:hypothetical protein
MKIVNVVALSLPYPEQFIGSRLECGTAKCHDGELFGEIVSVNNAELFDGIGGSSVFPVRSNLLSLGTGTVLKDILAILYKYFISITHNQVLFLYFLSSYFSQSEVI